MKKTRIGYAFSDYYLILSHFSICITANLAKCNEFYSKELWWLVYSNVSKSASIQHRNYCVYNLSSYWWCANTVSIYAKDIPYTWLTKWSNFSFLQLSYSLSHWSLVYCLQQICYLWRDLNFVTLFYKPPRPSNIKCNPNKNILKYFKVLLNIFGFFHLKDIVESWLVYVNKFSWIIQSCFLTETIK